MRFLHTADWHLGRSFHGESLLEAQAGAIDHLVEVAREGAVDAVLVSGDVYDRALPPVDAIGLADDALARLSEVAPVVLISGNHDSAARLGFAAALLDRAGVHVRTRPQDIGRPIRIGDACVYAIPYLEPDLTRTVLECADRGHGPVLSAAMARIRTDLATQPAGRRSVVLAHAFVAGAAPSDSERDLSVGGASSVHASTFAGVDYVALGHLHGPQRIGANARYAGSPVAFSFSEADHRKSVAVVELGADGPSVELVPTPVQRPLVVLRATLDELLMDPALAAHAGAWVQATLTDPVRPQDAMERLRKRFPHTAVLEFDPQGADAAPTTSYASRLRGLADAELLAGFVHDVRGRAASADELALLQEALTERRISELSA